MNFPEEEVRRGKGDAEPFIGLDLFLAVLALFSLLLVFVGGFLLWRASSTGLVERVEIENNRYLTDREVLDLLPPLEGTRIDGSILDGIAERLKRHRLIDRVEPEFKEGVLSIRIVERPCAAVIRTGDSLYDVDRQLHILSEGGRVRCFESPVIQGRFELRDDTIESERLKRMIDELVMLKQKKPELMARISEIRINEQNDLTVYITGARIRLEMKDDFSQENAKRLYAALSYFEKENYPSGVIDLRGADAILMPEK